MGKSSLLPPLSRRSFIKSITGGVGGLFWSSSLFGGEQWFKNYNVHEFNISRGNDLLNVKIILLNYKKISDYIYRPRVGKAPLVAVQFPPQNIAEEIFDESHENPTHYENDPLTNPTNSSQKLKLPLDHYISGPSWLIFSMERGDEISFVKADEKSEPVHDLFNLLSERNLKVPPVAEDINQQGSSPSPPNVDETRLEIPFRLYIAPERSTKVYFKLDKTYRLARDKEPLFISKGGTVATDTQIKYELDRPINSGNEVLWSAELKSRRKLEPAKSNLPKNAPKELQPPAEVSARAKAVWSPDYRAKNEPPFDTYYPAKRDLSLHALTRHLLVKQMAEGDGWIDVVHLIMTSIGANADFHYSSQKDIDAIIKSQLEGGKNAGADTNLRLWKHRIVIGRDVFIVEAFLGFLFPFGQPAVYVEVSERKPASSGKKVKSVGGATEGETSSPKKEKDLFIEVGGLGFFLLKKRYILLQDPVKNFCDNDSPFGRDMPVKSANVLTLQSPNLADPNDQDLDLFDEGKDEVYNEKKKGGIFFFPKSQETKQDINWDIELTDASGRKMRTTQSKLFFASNIRIGHYSYKRFEAVDRTMLFPAAKFGFTDESRIPAQPDPALKEQSSKEKDKGAVLETHSMVFGSSRIEEEFRILKKYIERTLGEGEELSKRVGNWIKSQKELIGENADEAIKAYAGKLSQAAEHAKAKGSQYIHTVMEAAEIIIPAVKGVSPNVPTRTIKLIDEYVSGGFEDIVENGVNVVKKVENEAYAKFTEILGQDGSIGEGIQNGIAQTAVVLAGVSRELGGIVAESEEKLQEFAKKIDNFSIEDAIPKMLIFGSIPLNKIIAKFIKKRELPTIESLDLPDKKVKKWFIGILLKEKKIGNILTFKVNPQTSETHKPALVVESTISLDLKKIKQENQLSMPPTEVTVEGLLGWAEKKDDKWVKPKKKVDKAYPVAVNLLDLIQVNVSRIDFGASYKSGEDFDGNFKPEIDEIEFLGPLAFVSKLQKFLAKLGIDVAKKKYNKGSVVIDDVSFTRKVENRVKSDLEKERGNLRNTFSKEQLNELEKTAAKLAVTEEKKEKKGLVEYDAKGVRAGFDFTLPPITFGVFSMWNIRLVSELDLPFVGAPMSFKFALSSFKQPFEISVMGYAGRGFLSVKIDASGKRELEGALEFGGSLAFNVSVARGNLYIMGGAYFKISKNSTTLKGYVRAGGCMRVIGLVNVSGEFFLGVTYRKAGNETQLYGTCTLCVNIDLGFWDTDVSIKMEKVIKGAKSSGSESLVKLTEGDELPERGPWLRRQINNKEIKGQFESTSDYNDKYLKHIAI